MSVQNETKRITTLRIREMKDSGEKISVLTAYDFSLARVLDDSGVDILLVGDSAANVMAGYETTLPITLDQMIYHGASVVRGVKRALVVVDLPFGTYQASPEQAFEAAVRVMKETGAQAIKVEGGVEIKAAIERITQAGIPVMGHLGLTPQSVNQFGGYGVRAQKASEAHKLKEDSLVLQQAGCFAIVLEKIPAKLTKEVTSQLNIPTIGIGAGPYCDGQVLVTHDMLGLNKGFKPKFLRQYADLYEQVSVATKQYTSDVKSGAFPNETEQY